MKTPDQVLGIFDQYTKTVDVEIKSLIDSHPDILMYQMMNYFMGYLDEDLKVTTGYGGKRFRPGLCLLLAEYYSSKENALEVAAAIEIFHNFTLIHDDIADGDLLRRGRPTVWNKWGINHGINTGDAQLILVTKELNKLIKRNPTLGIDIQSFCFDKFLDVAEGQFLDFTFSETGISNPNITEENTLDMMGRKSGILVGIPAKAAGMIAGISAEEQDKLWEFGYNLGLAYQLFDDIVSIWGSAVESGKDELMDLFDKKKTLPVIYLYRNSTDQNKKILETLYSKRGQLDTEEVSIVKTLLDENGARNYVEQKAAAAVTNVMDSIETLSLTREHKDKLIAITFALLPDAERLIK
jgi:geranylgeranyl pyrophosphate synthase